MVALRLLHRVRPRDKANIGETPDTPSMPLPKLLLRIDHFLDREPDTLL